MKIIKKLSLVLLAGLTVFSMAACSGVAEKAEEDVSEAFEAVDEKVSEGIEKVDNFNEDEMSKAIQKDTEKIEAVESAEKAEEG